MKLRTAFALALLACASAAQGSIITYTTTFAPEASLATGSGSAVIEFDDVTHVLRYVGSFTGLSGNATQAHFHCCTALPGTGTAGIAVDSPSLLGFPVGATSGSFDASVDLDNAANFNAGFLTASGGTTDLAIARFIRGISEGRTYLNIHTTAFPGGEIRGFLAVPEPASAMLLGLGLLGLAVSRRKRTQ